MPQNLPIQVVQLTPPGRGAVATLLVEGVGAIGLVQAQFRARGGRSLASEPDDRLVLGHFGAPPGEEVVVRRRGAEALELHCHGGKAAVAMIEQALVAAGGRRVAWRDWLAGRHADPTAAAAWAALAEAPTERTASILLDQYHGALRRALEEIEQAVQRGDVSSREKIDALLAHADLGLHLVRPWQVVLTGRPNVGKSSLLNAMVGYRRAIVHPTPGTTQDVVSVATAIDGWPVELADTAGLHAGGGTVERAGIERARERLAAADLVLLLFDRSTPWREADQELLNCWPQGLVVYTKCDLPPAAGFPGGGVCTSVLSGEGVETLAKALIDRLVPQPPPSGAAVPFTAEQIEQIARRRT
jgi:tRNA modification GTPase